jgi:hypothetical protein
VNGTLAHIDFIQRASADDESQMGWFIELPHGTSVTVNGTTYTNSDDLTPTPFYIGPLEGYTIIELLSQPAFFFRNKGSLKDTPSQRVVTQEELERRDPNGDVALEDTTVRWRRLDAPPLGSQSDNEAVAEGAGSESESGFSDAFTDEGKPIEDPCAYARAHLLSDQQERYRELIPRVLASVNYRLSEATGFSYQHQDQTFRPGRTLLTLIEIDGNYILLAAHIQPDKRIILRVLNPMTWRSTLDSRKIINESVKNVLCDSSWWRHGFESSDDMYSNLPKDTLWVPVAQVTTNNGSFTYTVLNAWALAMGLAPNPSFTPSARRHESFLLQAHQIFEMALRDRFTWKILLAFFRCTGFVKWAEGGEGDEAAKLPATLRRFNLCKRSFQKLITGQTAADAKAESKKIDMELVTLDLEDGTGYDLAFAADSLSELERNNVASIVRDGEWKLKMTEEQLRRRLEKRAKPKKSDPPAPPPKVLHPQQDYEEIPEDFNPCEYLDTRLKVLAEERITGSTPESESEQVVPSMLSSSDVFLRIEPVSRAINELLQPGVGFTLLDFDGFTRYSTNAPLLDPVVLVVYQKKEHVILVTFQDEGEVGNVRTVARVMDSAPWTFAATERAAIHEHLHDKGELIHKEKHSSPKDKEVIPKRSHLSKGESIVGPVLEWMSGPQQAQEEEAGYFAIMSAWAILLGLPSNDQFRTNKQFYKRALPLFQAVQTSKADWKLIWAFLRCVGYTQSEQPPPPQRRFKATRPSHGNRAINSKGKRARSTDAEACDDVNYSHFPVGTGLAHTQAFPWDGYDKPDRKARLPELISSGEYTNVLQTPPVNPSTGAQASSNQHKDLGTEALATKDGLVGAGADPPHDGNPVPEDLSTFDEVARIPKLQRLGTFDKDLSREDIRKRYDALSEDFRPCEHLRRTLVNLLENDKVKEEIQAFRSDELVTTEIGEWLHNEEVAMYAATVLMAINDMQGVEEGFSMVTPVNTQMCAAKDFHSSDMDLQPPALRPGRPLLMPLNYESHFVLAIVQLNEMGSPEISVLDSLFYSYSAAQREHIFQTIWAVVCRTAWYRRHFANEAAFKKVKPPHATWVRAALQPSTNECGYFTIFNAWGLALGLELNPAVRLKWTTTFFEELHNILSLVRTGHADWKLIFAFLRCHDIVREGSVPENRRFAQTHAIRDVETMDRELEDLESIEQVYWQDRLQDTQEEKTKTRRCNRVPGLKGRRHNQSSGFPSDKWTNPDTMSKHVPRLQQLGILNIDDTGPKVAQAYKESLKIPYQRFERAFLQRGTDSGKFTRDELVQGLRNHLETYYGEMEVYYQKYPGERSADAIRTYSYFMSKGNAVVQRQFEKFAAGDMGRSYDAWRRPLSDSEVNFAMVSVLEAIDNLQAGLHAQNNSAHPFAGGLALTPSFILPLAMAPDPDNEFGLFYDPLLSRPRRAWLMPMVVSEGGLLPHVRNWAKKNGVKWALPKDGGPKGHTFLAIVQETFNKEDDEFPGGTHFEVQFADSRPSIFQNVTRFLRGCIVDAATRLGWSEHRIVFGNVAFESGVRAIEVPEQLPGGWQCGHHTIINAWIIALGLHPDKEAKYTDSTYRVIYQLAQAAVAGILDWKTLAQWLVARKLTMEKSAEDVPVFRRFESTRVQKDDNDLGDRIRGYQLEDGTLATMSLTETPYDHPNSNYNEIPNEEADALDRALEDPDTELLGQRKDFKRKLRDGCNNDLDCSVDAAVAQHGRHAGSANSLHRSKRRRLSSTLSFLDTY